MPNSASSVSSELAPGTLSPGRTVVLAPASRQGNTFKPEKNDRREFHSPATAAGTPGATTGSKYIVRKSARLR
jgi:hypothetical protein